jgi:hypothetical protein
VHSFRGLTPQWIFYAAIFALAVVVAWDGYQADPLTGVYPMVAGGLCLVVMIPMGIQMYSTRKAASVFYDAERQEINEAVERHSNEYYLMWLLGMLGVSALIGFVGGIGAFIYAFVRLKARLSHFAAAISAVVFILLLGTLSHFMTLQYPEGILQSYVTLPWPFQ